MLLIKFFQGGLMLLQLFCLNLHKDLYAIIHHTLIYGFYLFEENELKNKIKQNKFNQCRINLSEHY